jgi:hypothetical protein
METPIQSGGQRWTGIHGPFDFGPFHIMAACS